MEDAGTEVTVTVFIGDGCAVSHTLSGDKIRDTSGPYGRLFQATKDGRIVEEFMAPGNWPYTVEWVAP